MRKKRSRKYHKQRLWIVEARYKSGEWDICDFTSLFYAHTNYFYAHDLKRKIIDYCVKFSGARRDKNAYVWLKEDFRVREYRMVKQDIDIENVSRFVHQRRITL